MSRPTWDQTWMSVAKAIAGRSRCSARRVGAVIVSPDNRDQWVGYNGPPGGFQAPPETPESPGCSSYCRQGERAVWPNLELLVDVPAKEPGCPSVHAEVNALMQSSRDLRRGGTVYVTAAPCWKCALAVLNSGASRLVCPQYEPFRGHLQVDVEALAAECGVEVVYWLMGLNRSFS